MFNNIVGKIKGLAQIICWIGIAISAIIGFIGIVESGFGGIVIMCLGILFSWIASLIIYGFGELIEKTTEIAKNTKNHNLE